jgi:phenylalanine-4-hydroxylase
MSYKETSYVAKLPDANGIIHYTEEENAVWHDLMARQIKIVENRACDEYMHGLELLNLPKDRIPQCQEVSKVLKAATGWELEPVPALIPFDEFFNLLANKKFPAAAFIRTREEFDYLTEPDIFHEIFGHCPLLTNKAYADFAHLYGQLGAKANHADRVMLARLYWFTIEFGLIKTAKGTRIYGGGILSSVDETVYCLESPIPIRKHFDVMEALRTPYRIDVKQKVYFVIESFNEIFKLLNMDLLDLIRQARVLGEYELIE